MKGQLSVDLVGADWLLSQIIWDVGKSQKGTQRS